MSFNQQQAKPALRLTQCAPPNWPVSSGRKHTHCANPHSNNRSTQTNPAISRLSASPTPGNVPRHPNLARGVRETYTFAAFHHHLKMLRCGQSERPFAATAKSARGELTDCGQTGLMHVRLLLTQHLSAVAAMFMLRCSLRRGSGRSKLQSRWISNRPFAASCSSSHIADKG